MSWNRFVKFKELFEVPPIQALRNVPVGLRLSGERHTIVTLANVEHKETIHRALDWLIQQQHDRGYWGEQNETATSLSMVALHSWSQASLPGFSVQESNDCTKAGAEWLKERFRQGWGSFPKIWIRSVALCAVNVCGYWDMDFETEVSKLLSAAKRTEAAITDENAHHYARLLVLLRRLERSGDIDEIAPRFAEYVVSMNNFSAYSAYYLNEILQGCRAADWSQHNCLNRRPEAIVTNLQEYVKGTVVDSWSFVPYCSSLIALGDEESATSKSLLRDSYFKIFREGGRRVDGSFYSDIPKTCWALMALQRLREVHRLTMPLHTFHGILEETESTIVENIHSIRRDAALLIVYVLLSLILLVFWTKLDMIDWVPRNVLAWFLGALSVVILGKLSAVIRRFVA